MKKNIWILILLLSVITACEDNNDDSGVSPKVNEIKTAVAAGEWQITYFFDTDTEETNNFSGYVFTFDISGVITSTNGSDTYTGTWSVTDDDSGDDDNSLEDIDFNIKFTSPPDFEDLTEDWEIISQSATKIELRHASGGNGGTDLLSFEKI